MTPDQWRIHKRELCEHCEYGLVRGKRRCPALAIMDAHPDDTMCSHLFAHTGHCSQYKYKFVNPKKKDEKRR